ncbi:MAG: hypothetical protein ACT4O2_10220 [Beijerinckiaceae bacterium]
MFDQIPIRRVIGAFGVVLAGSVWAQGEGEPSLQQAQAECSSIAQEQTGSNPNAAPTTTASQPQAGGRARGAAAGAMGAARQRQQRRQSAGTQQQAQQQQAASANAYNQAYASCMAAKGFPG